MSAGAQQAPSGSSPSHRARLRRFEQELAANPISMKQLRRLAFHGIAEKEGLRATTWKVLSLSEQWHAAALLLKRIQKQRGRKTIVLHHCQDLGHALHCSLCIMGLMDRCWSLHACRSF